MEEASIYTYGYAFQGKQCFYRMLYVEIFAEHKHAPTESSP